MFDADKVFTTSVSPDGWLVGFKDHSGLHLWVDEDGSLHTLIQYPDGSEKELQ